MLLDNPIAIPVYDIASLALIIRNATEQFHGNWMGRLGLTWKPGISQEHWTRVKALSRRFAFQWDDQYDTLRPVADLIKLLSERIGNFVSNPHGWNSENSSEESRQAAINKVAQEIYTRLHTLIKDRLFHEHLREWMNAYSRSGWGSTRTRANDIRGIYEIATPIPNEGIDKENINFLDAILTLFIDSVSSAGGKIIGK